MKNLLILSIIAMSLSSITFAYPVMYNTSTGKYHQPWCKWAKKMHSQLHKIDHKEAIRRGGIPCKICGG